ncbi:MAG: M42 family metallopeptidase [Flavobacteriales bacterium]|nr:M42 family metallopeptidase [Flavobacteriales bacterium]
MRKESKKFLKDYLNNASPTGHESSGQQIWLDYLKPYIDEYITDPYGTAVGVVNPGKKYKVVIEAHADEIAWFVNYITPEGYIYVIRNGGSDAQIAPSMRVNLHGEKGIVKGIFGWPAIHVREPGKEESPSLKNIFIDCGAKNKDEVHEMGIHVGTVVTFVDEMMELNKDFIVGRALDNRIGGFMIAEVARLLKENKKKLPFTLYVVNSVQEEIGLRGAEMISRRLKPDVAIVTDVTHDTTSPMYNKKEQGEIACGKGPALTIGASVHNNVFKMLVEVAEKNKIPYQRSATSRTTGTDTDMFAYSAEGVPSALISLPLKYMHTTVETIHKNDLENVIQLMYECVLNLKAGQDFRYIK